MESIQIFLKLDSLFKAKLNVRAKTIQLINRSVGNIGFRWSYIISVLILQRHAYLWSSLLRRGSQWGFRCKNPLGKVGAGAKEQDPLLHSLRTADSPHLKPVRASAEERAYDQHYLARSAILNPAICGQSCFLIMPKPAKRAARWVVPYLYSALLLVSLSLCRPFHKYPHIFGGLWEVSEILIQKILI